MKLLLRVNLILKNNLSVPPFFYYFLIFITMRKRHWKDRKNSHNGNIGKDETTENC